MSKLLAVLLLLQMQLLLRQLLQSNSHYQPDSLTLSLVANDVSCFGLNNGSIDVTVDGGTTPFSYSWSNGEITQDISLLNQDSYSVLVTDYNNCSVSDSAGIIEPDLLQINIDSIVHLSCFNDSSALISVSNSS